MNWKLFINVLFILYINLLLLKQWVHSTYKLNILKIIFESFQHSDKIKHNYFILDFGKLVFFSIQFCAIDRNYTSLNDLLNASIFIHIAVAFIYLNKLTSYRHG